MDINTLVRYFSLVGYTPFPHFISKQYCGLGSILLFHNISDKRKVYLKNGSYYRTVTPQKLEELILFLKKRDYTFLSMDSLYGFLKKGIKPPKFAVFTLDDGMLDNYIFAYPVFKKYNIPFIIYIPTRFIGSKESLTPLLLEEFILSKDKIKLSGIYGDEEINVNSMAEKESLLNKLIETAEYYGINNCHVDLFDKNNWKGYQLQDRSYLNWEEVRLLSNDPLCTIGSHTVNHLMLSSLSEDELKQELTESRKSIENQIQKEVSHLAYPYGTQASAFLREFECAVNSGYKTATTVRYANIHPEHSDFLYSLPRYTMKPYYSNKHISLIESGAIQFIVNKGKKIVV